MIGSDREAHAIGDEPIDEAARGGDGRPLLVGDGCLAWWRRRRSGRGLGVLRRGRAALHDRRGALARRLPRLRQLCRRRARRLLTLAACLGLLSGHVTPRTTLIALRLRAKSIHIESRFRSRPLSLTHDLIRKVCNVSGSCLDYRGEAGAFGRQDWTRQDWTGEKGPTS